MKNRFFKPTFCAFSSTRTGEILSADNTGTKLKKGMVINMEMDIMQIKEILPHRYPFLLIDRITDCVPGVSASGRKCVTVNEEFFCGHFPQKPVMPGVLIIEALAQVGAVALLTEEANRGKIALFGGIKKARFKKQVVPGDVLELECTLTERHGPIGFGKAIARVDGKIAATAELTFAIE